MTEIISMETLSEEFKPITSEIYQFENQQSTSAKWSFSHVESIYIQT